MVRTGDDFKLLGEDSMLRELELKLKERSEREHSYNVKFSDNVGMTDDSRRRVRSVSGSIEDTMSTSTTRSSRSAWSEGPRARTFRMRRKTDKNIDYDMEGEFPV